MFSRYANKESRTRSNGNTKPIHSDRYDVPNLEMCWKNVVLKVLRLHSWSPCTRLDVINIHSSNRWTEHCASPNIDQNISMEDKILMSENMNGLTCFKATTIQVPEPEPSHSLLVFPKQIEEKLKVSLKKLKDCNTYGNTSTKDAANFEDTLHEKEFSMIGKFLVSKGIYPFHDKNPPVSAVKEGTAGDIQHGAVTSIIKENLVMHDCSWVIEAEKLIQLKTNDTTNIGVNVNENCAIAHDIQLAINGNDYSRGPADTTANTIEISFNCYKKRVSERCMQPKTKYVIRQSSILVYIKGTSGYTQQFETFCAAIQTPYHGFYCFGETFVESVIHAKAEINILLKKTDHDLRCKFQQPVTIKIISSKITEQMADQQTPAPHKDGRECVRANSPRVIPADSVPLTDVDITHVIIDDLCDEKQTCQFNHLTNLMMLMCMVLNIISVRVNQDMSNHKHMATEKEGDRHTPLSTKMIHQRHSMPKNKKWKHKKKQHFELASNASFLTALCIGLFLKRGLCKVPCVLVMTILAMTLMASGHPVSHTHDSRECRPTISKGTSCKEELGGVIFLECEISACNDDFTLKFEKKTVHNEWKPAFYYVNNTHYRALHSDTGYDLGNRTDYKAYMSKHTLHINPLDLEDTGDWRCVVHNSNNRTFTSNELAINIYGTAGSKNVYITPNNQHVVNGQTANFACTLNGMYSEPIVVWKVNGSEQSHGKAANERREDGLWKVTSTITLEFNTTGQCRLSCVITTKNKDPLLTGITNIDVKDHPMIFEPHATIKIMTDLTSHFTLKCNGLGYTPHITWQKDGKVIPRNDSRYHIEQQCNETACQGNITSNIDTHCINPKAYAGQYKCVISLGAPYYSTIFSPNMSVIITERACKENYVVKAIGFVVLIVMVIVVTAVICVIWSKNKNVGCILKTNKNIGFRQAQST